MDPLVSICCQTYNHKNYISEALESFLMQKTNFSFEILLRDDASTDGTAEICKNYASKYPDLINLLAYEENQFSKGVKPFADNVKRARSKYIAICEGDDYWTDPYKLQKQVDFLEKNTEYSMCFHNCYFQKGREIEIVSRPFRDDITLVDLAKREIYIPTLTVLYRNILNPIVPNHFVKLYTGSYFWFIRLAEKGKLKYLDEAMAVYRIHDGGVWSGKSIDQKGEMALKNKAAMVIYFKKNKKLYRLFKMSYVKAAILYSFYSIAQHKVKTASKFIRKSFLFGFSFTHLFFGPKFIIQFFVKRVINIFD